MEETKNLCSQIPLSLHTRVREEQERANQTVGGLVGLVESGSIERCYATGDVDSTREDGGGLGGLVGELRGTVKNSFAMGVVSTRAKSGGLVGVVHRGSVSSCYTLSNNGNGLMGIGTATASYFNKDMTGPGSANLSGARTTAELRQESTYEGWDFLSVWALEEGAFPTLLGLPAPELDSSYFSHSSVDTLAGTVTIDGTARYGELLTALVHGDNNTGTLSYQWQRGGADISGETGHTHTLTADDIGVKITCVVTSTVQTGSIIGYSETVDKAEGFVASTGLTAIAPTTLGGEDGMIDGTTAFMEYADNPDFIGAADSANGKTTGLTAGVYYVRVKETATRKASAYTTVTVTDGHVHNSETGWAVDNDGHWQVCSCGKFLNQGEHLESDWIVDTPATDTNEGSMHKECRVCGHLILVKGLPATDSENNSNPPETDSSDGGSNQAEPGASDSNVVDTDTSEEVAATV